MINKDALDRCEKIAVFYDVSRHAAKEIVEAYLAANANPSMAEGYYLPKGHPDHPFTGEKIQTALDVAADILLKFKSCEADNDGKLERRLEEWQACYAKLFTQMAELGAIERTHPREMVIDERTVKHTPLIVKTEKFNPMVTITSDGELRFAEGVTPRDAAIAIEKFYNKGNKVREMTVEEVAGVLRQAIRSWDEEAGVCNQWTDLSGDEMMDVYAKALARLGAIRVRDDV